jgi:hypothetical protein
VRVDGRVLGVATLVTITKADEEKRVVHELNGEPAALV